MTKTTLTAVFVILVVSLVGLNLAMATISGPANFVVSSFTAANQGKNLAKLSATTGADISRQPDVFVNSHAVAGIAWADLDTGKVFVTTIHPVLGRDSNQNPDSWHAHTATLSAGAGSADFCVASIDSTPTAGISIKDSTISVNVKQSDLSYSVSDIDAAVGFVIDPEGACASGLGVRVVTP